MAAGPTSTTKMPGKMNSTSGENELHGGFRGLFLGHLTTPRAHGIALRAKCLGDARTEPVGLDQHGGQRPQVGHAGSGAQFVQDLDARPSHLQLEIGDGELFGQDAVRTSHFFGDLAHGLVKAQSGLHANDHQVEGVGQGEKDCFLPAAADQGDDDIGQIKHDSGKADGPDQRFLVEAA